MKFCDMPYERIDVKAATEALDAAAERLSAAKTLEEAEEAFSEREKIISHVQTMNTIAYIRHTVNTLDEFYEKENDFNFCSLCSISGAFSSLKSFSFS